MNRTSWNCVPDPLPRDSRVHSHCRAASAATGTGSTAGLKGRGASFVQDASDDRRLSQIRRRRPDRSVNIRTSREESPRRRQWRRRSAMSECTRRANAERVRAPAAMSGCASDVPRQATTRATAQRDVATRRRREVVRGAFDLAGAGWTTERRTCSVARDQVKCLRRIERRRSRLAHMLLPRDNNSPGSPWRRFAL